MGRDRRNRIFFGLGTVGRDMMYTMLGSYLLVYLTEVLDLPDATMWWLSGILVVLRMFDALNDPLMGMLVDNMDSKWGKFKPGILVGSVLSSAFLVLLFSDMGLRGPAFLVVFSLLSVAWDLSFGLNDIAYWSMLPALSLRQEERERVGAFARFCANTGMYLAAVFVLPAVKALEKTGMSERRAWLAVAAAVAFLTIGFQVFTLYGVKEKRGFFKKEDRTSLQRMLRAIFANDQLLSATVAMSLFMTGFSLTIGFSVYFFKYAYGNEAMYAPFAAVLGIAQLAALAAFPCLTRKLKRKRFYSVATMLMVVGYLLFILAPMRLLPIGVAGLLIFVGQAFIQLLMLMSLADTVEYGQWITGMRNESVTLSLQPLVSKLGSALAAGIISVTLIVSGINSARTPQEVSPGGLFALKVAMLVLPLLCVLAAYVLYRRKFTLDETFHKEIVCRLEQRGDLPPSAPPGSDRGGDLADLCMLPYDRDG